MKIEIMGLRSKQPQVRQVAGGARQWSEIDRDPRWRIYLGRKHYSFKELEVMGDGIHEIPGPKKARSFKNTRPAKKRKGP